MRTRRATPPRDKPARRKPSQSRNEAMDRRRSALAFVAGAALTVFAATALLAWTLPAPAHAATLHRNGFDAVPPDTVSVEHPLSIEKAEFTTTNAHFIREELTIWNERSHCIVYDLPVSAMQEIEGSFTLFWKNAGIDDDGDDIDLKITVSGIKAAVPSNDLLILDDSRYLCVDAVTRTAGDASIELEMDVAAFKHGTSQPAAGTMLVAFTDIDVPKQKPRLSEQVELLRGFGEDVWVPQTNFLDISEDASRFTATRIDENTYDSGFVTTADTGGFSIKWQGDSCGTYVLMPFMADKQIITATGTNGGSISDGGETFVRWKNDKTYAIAPDDGHIIADVVVDGKSQGPVESYTFERVTESHTIHAVFEEIPLHSVRFEDGFGNTILERKVRDGSTVEAPENPTAEGWAFAGWDKDLSHVTEDLVVTALWDPLISVEIPTLVACAIMMDGTVLAPDGYVIRNHSPVAVELASVKTSDMPDYGTYRLVNEAETVIHSYERGSDASGSQLTIGAGGRAHLSWKIGKIEGAEAQDLLLRALQGPSRLCEVSFVFRAA